MRQCRRARTWNPIMITSLIIITAAPVNCSVCRRKIHPIPKKTWRDKRTKDHAVSLPRRMLFFSERTYSLREKLIFHSLNVATGLLIAAGWQLSRASRRIGMAIYRVVAPNGQNDKTELHAASRISQNDPECGPRSVENNGEYAGLAIDWQMTFRDSHCALVPSTLQRRCFTAISKIRKTRISGIFIAPSRELINNLFEARRGKTRQDEARREAD